LVISAAQKTNDVAGDGTTTATLLTRELYREAIKALAAGLDANSLRKGMNIAVESIVNELKKQTRKVTTPEEIAQVASVSANGDKQIGKLIADAFKAVGQEGVITAQVGKTFDHKLEIVDGMKVERGYISMYFMTDPKSLKCEYENAFVLVTDAKISTFQQIQPLLEAIVPTGRPLLIIAEDIEGDALAALIVNKLRGGLKVVAIKAPGFGDNRKAILADIATVTGGQVVTEEIGLKLESVSLSQLGNCQKVIVSKDDTIVMGGQGHKEAIDGRAADIRTQLNETESKYEKDKLKERLAKLTGGVAVINVGGANEVEVNETKDLIEDALNATRAAIEEGVVVGGGVALLKASKALELLKGETLDLKNGIDIVAKAIVQPAKYIAKNAGQSGDVVASKILEGNENFGYDAQSGKYGDMIEAGIIDPTKVVRLALINAASIASSMTSADVMISDEPEENKQQTMMPPQMGGAY
jgi:chaperonin GroEL